MSRFDLILENDNENQKLIEEEWIQGLIEVVVERLEIDIIEKIIIGREKNKEVVRVVEKVGVKVLRENKWQIEGDLVLKKGKVYILKDEKLRVEIIWLHHDILVARHRRR